MPIINNHGPRQSEVVIANIEARLGSPLPEDYRRFLIELNGGSPSPNSVEVHGFPGGETDVQVFFGIDRPVRSSCLDWNMDTFAERLNQFDGRLLPIAKDSGGNLFFLSLHTGKLGVVSYCDLEAVFGDLSATPELYFVNSSFKEFLESLH